MTQGYSGGFFLPAQRSVHCKGGFFASATRTPAPGSNAPQPVSKSHHPQQFSVLFTLPQAGNNTDNNSTSTASKRPVRRVYDPEEGDEDAGLDDPVFRRVEVEEPKQPLPAQVQRSNSTSGFVRGRQHISLAKRETTAQSRATRSAGNSEADETTAKPKATAKSGHRIPEKTSAPEGDINNKFELAMKELNQIKGEFDLKQQRSAPALVTTNRDQIPHTSIVPSAKKETVKISPPSHQPDQPTDHQEAPPPRDLQSPRQRLQVAEMVMRKLYKKNLQTEKELATTKAANELMAKKLAEFEAGKAANATAAVSDSSHSPAVPASAASTPTCTKCSMNERVGFVLANPPSMETISRIDQQQLDYLRHLAAEQDRTITSLKIRIEELSTQLFSAKQQQQQAPHTPGGAKALKNKSTTPRQVVNKLQSKLQDARHESERQKSNYLKLKRDFQHLLALKTKTLYENPQALNASARGLVELMEKQLKKLEMDHSVDLAGYNSKLYEIEQQSCESYAQRRMMEEEMERVAKDVQQRDAIDVEIEQCIANVFERLHHVESENLHLKKRFSSTD